MEVRLVDNPNQIAVRDWDENTVKVMKKLSRYISQLESTLPKDSLNRPLALVNPTAVLSTGLLMPLDEFIDSPPSEVILPISYLEGLPTINGVPIWEKLEGEKIEYYKLFKRYRELQDEKGKRTIYKLHKETGIPVSYLELIRQTHAWQIRVKAYDEYMEAERQHIIEMQQRELQGRHRAVAKQIFAKCTEYMLENVQMLTPRTALQWAELAVKLERISLGLQPDKPGTINNKDTPIINIQNTVNTVPNKNDNGTGITGDLSEDRQRLAQLLSVMDKIGLFNQMKEEAIDIEPVEEEETETE